MSRACAAPWRRMLVPVLMLGVWLAGCLPPAAAQAGSQPVLRYGVLAGFPPFQVWPPGARPGGADVEIVAELARDAGLVVQPVRYTSFAALEADLLAGRIQLASAMARTPAREARLLFLPPYTQVPLALVTRADQPSAALLPDLAGRSVAVVRGYASNEQVDRLFPLASRVVVNDISEGLRAVQQGRADVLLETLPTVADLIERERHHDLSIVRRVDAPTGRLHLALAPGQQAAAAALGRAAAAYPPGRVEALIQAWSATPQAQPPRQVVLSAGERASLQAWGPLRVGVVGQEPSFALRNAQGRFEGLSVDVLRAVLAQLGLEVAEWVALTPAELPQALLERRIDIALGADEDADRSPLLRFVGPFIEYPTVLVGRPESGAFDLEQLHGRRLALTPNSPARPLVDSRHPGITVVNCLDVHACIDDVVAGRAEATLADVVTVALALAQRPRPEVQMIGSEPRLRRFHSLALAARHTAQVPLVKRALDAVQAHELPAIKTRWFSRPSQGELLRRLGQRYGPWLAALLLALAGLWLWHVRTLRTEVQRTRAAQAEAERSAASNRRFTAFLAHEVRNSLHAVIAGTELARGAVPGPATAGGADVSEMLAGSARGTLHLLNNLIDRERLHQGRLVLDPSPARLAELVRGVVDELRPAATVRHQTLVVQPGPDGPPLLLDGLRLQQVVRNLLANAIKYAGPGSIELAWGQQSAAEGEQAWVTVSDRGPGLPAFDAGGERLDSGLGLDLCRDLARLMHGELGLLPREGGGLVARLALQAPLADVAPPAALQASLDVLLVEDAEVYALLLQRALELRGHRVRWAVSAQAALDLLSQRRPDLLLSDLNLADGDAGPLLSAWRGLPVPERPALVLMSADLATSPAWLQAQAEGLVVLQKTDDVRTLVARALGEPARAASGQG